MKTAIEGSRHGILLLPLPKSAITMLRVGTLLISNLSTSTGSNGMHTLPIQFVSAFDYLFSDGYRKEISRDGLCLYSHLRQDVGTDK